MKKISKRKVFGLITVSFCLVVLGLFLLPSSLSNLIPVSSIEFTSQNLDYDNQEPGSYKVTKSAKWIEENKAQVTIELDTTLKKRNDYADIIIVLDVSSGVGTSNFEIIKNKIIEYSTEILSSNDNTISLIAFATNASIFGEYTNDIDEVTTAINNINYGGLSNYYQAFTKVDELLENYDYSPSRDCTIFLVSNTIPNKDTPNEIPQYQYLKQQYPYIKINAIKYQDNEMISQVENVTDDQFIVTENNFTKTMINASNSSITYTNLSITEQIENEHFTITSFESTDGDITVSGDNITWKLDGLSSGKTEMLNITLALKENYQLETNYYPTSKGAIVVSEMNAENENINNTLTPILSSHYQVVYDANLPDGCTVDDSFIENENIKVFGIGTFTNEDVSCSGYDFKGWRIITEGVVQFGDNSFIMPEKNIEVRGVWSSTKIVKTVNGKIAPYSGATLQAVTGDYTGEIWGYKDSITKIVFQNELNEITTAEKTFDVSENDNSGVMAYLVLNQDSTTYTAYIQGENGVIANSDSSWLFSYFVNLTTIEGLEYLDTTNVVNMERMFRECNSLTNLDLSSFRTSNVTNIAGMFRNCTNLVSLNLSSFDTSNVTLMNELFDGCNSLLDLNLSNFNTSKVTTMESMFVRCHKLKTLNINSFNTSNVTTMYHMFSFCYDLLSLDLNSFNTSNVENMSRMFWGCSSLSNLDLSSFNTTKVTEMGYMFTDCTSLINLNVTSFDTSNVNSLYAMFDNCSSLSNLNLKNFNTANVATMQAMFRGCNSLTSLDLSNFITTNLTTMFQMFYECTKLTNLNLSNFDTTKVQDFTGAFYNCQSLTYLDIRKLIFYTIAVGDMFTNVPSTITVITNSSAKGTIEYALGSGVGTIVIV